MSDTSPKKYFLLVIVDAVSIFTHSWNPPGEDYMERLENYLKRNLHNYIYLGAEYYEEITKIDKYGIYEMEFEGRFILTFSKEPITSAIMVSNPTPTIKEQIIQFTNGFHSNYAEELQKSQPDQLNYSGASELIKKYFDTA